MPDALVFDLKYFFSIAHCDIQDSWFLKYYIPDDLGSVKRSEYEGIVYFLDERAVGDDFSVVIVDLSGSDPVFKNDNVDRYVLDRNRSHPRCQAAAGRG